MSAEFKIVFVDEGGAAAPADGGPVPGAPALDRTPGPADRTTGPKKPAADSVTRDLESAAQKVSNVLGLGGLTGTAIELRRAFADLFHSVTDAARAAEANRRADVSGPRAGEIKTPTVPQTTDMPAIPRVGTFERQAAKGDVAAPPVSRAVTAPIPQLGWWERQAAKGAVAAPPVSAVPPVAAGVRAGATVATAVPAVARAAAVAGPAVAGSSSAGALALGAMGGPVGVAIAAAVVTLTTAITAGAAAVKKAFDHLHNETERLSGLSARLSGALARSDIRAEFADIRRANRVGPGLARVTDTTSRAQEAATELWTAILEQLLRIEQRFEPMIDIATALMQIASKAAPPLIKGAEAALQVTSPIIQTADSLAALSKLIRDYLKLGADDKEPDVNDPFMDAFLGLFAGKMDDRDRAKALQAAGARGRAGGGLGAN